MVYVLQRTEEISDVNERNLSHSALNFVKNIVEIASRMKIMIVVVL